MFKIESVDTSTGAITLKAKSGVTLYTNMNYNLQFDLELSTGSVVRTGDLKIKLKQSKVYFNTSATYGTCSVLTGDQTSLTISAYVKGVNGIVPVNISTINNANTKNTFNVTGTVDNDKATLQYGANTAKISAGKTYTNTVSITFADQAGNSKATSYTVKVKATK